ncbi:uncharacterized protein LOC129124597 [Agelaius phoeniceus]|uniref:uncharacterized protein LOC129124597 n=1 Tax=Agelaius phoeniceus TaxID=39638 RepID=UPI0040551B79
MTQQFVPVRPPQTLRASLLPAAAASLPFNYQLKPQHRATPRPPPPPPNPFQRREGEAAGLLSPGAGAPPGPARAPGRRAAPAPAAAPRAAPAAARSAARSLRSAEPLAAVGSRYPSAGVVTSGPRECPPSGRPGGGRGAGRWWHRRRGSDPARHRGAAAAAPLRGGRASGDPARCPPLPGCHGDRLPASQNGGGGAARGRCSLRRPGRKERRKEGRLTGSLRRHRL